MNENMNHENVDSVIKRDPVLSIFFGFGALVLFFLTFVTFRMAFTGHAELLRPALLMTGIFAAVGMMFGLVRSVRNGRALARAPSLR